MRYDRRSNLWLRRRLHVILISHLLAKTRKSLSSVSIAANHTFEGSGKVKETLANPEAFAIAAAPAAIAGEIITAPAEVKPSHGNCFSRSMMNMF